MPSYTYSCTHCDATQVEVLKIAERDKYVGSACPACADGYRHRSPEAPGFTNSESLGRIKADSEFRNLLSVMKKAHPGSNIKER